jgi:hypothetical protein
MTHRDCSVSDAPQPAALDAKKYPESGHPDLWRAGIAKGWRFYSRIDGDLCIIGSPTEHPK